MGDPNTLQSGTAVIQQNGYRSRVGLGLHSSDIEIPVTIQITQDRGSGVDRIVGRSLKRAVAIAQLDRDISVAGRNSIQLFIVIHICEDRSRTDSGGHGCRRVAGKTQNDAYSSRRGGVISEVRDAVSVKVPDKQRGGPVGKRYLRWDGKNGWLRLCVR